MEICARALVVLEEELVAPIEGFIDSELIRSRIDKLDDKVLQPIQIIEKLTEKSSQLNRYGSYLPKEKASAFPRR